jgi:hypothetical protein
MTVGSAAGRHVPVEWHRQRRLATTTSEAIASDRVSTPDASDDGRVRLTERWRRLNGSSGVSHTEEIAE